MFFRTDRFPDRLCPGHTERGGGPGDTAQPPDCAQDRSSCPLPLPPYIQSLLDWRISGSSSAEERRVTRQRAALLVEGLDITACLTLLRLWVMALVARDASVIIAMEEVS